MPIGVHCRGLTWMRVIALNQQRTTSVIVVAQCNVIVRLFGNPVEADMEMLSTSASVKLLVDGGQKLDVE
jgi:hypothetical protein